MRLLFLNHNVVGSGTYLRAFNLGRHLTRLGHEVTLVATSRTARLRVTETSHGRLKIVAVPDLLSGRLRNGVCPWNLLTRVLYLRRRDFDLVHAFDTRPVVIFPSLHYASRHHVPLVIDWADWWGRGGTIRERSGQFYALTLGRVETFFEEHFRRYADGATTISLALRQRLIGLGYPEGKILLLRNGSDLPEAAPPAKEHCRRVLGLPPRVRLIGHLGTLFERDAQLLFDSLKILANERGDTKLALIGRHRLNLTRGDGLGSLLIETGEVARERLPLWLSACDVLVLPLRKGLANEGRWPSKVNDYFSSGRPVVSTPVGDIGGILENEGIGVLADDRPEAFARALDELLGDPARQDRLGRGALEFVRDRLDWRLIAKAVEKFYNQALQMRMS